MRISGWVRYTALGGKRADRNSRIEKAIGCTLLIRRLGAGGLFHFNILPRARLLWIHNGIHAITSCLA